VPLPDKPGSEAADGGWVADRSGLPAVWIKEVVGGRVETALAPKRGKLADLVRKGEIVQDPRLDACRAENPSDP
jgi:hypothetical protein